MKAETHPDFAAALAAAKEAHPESGYYGLTRIPASGPPSWKKARRYPVDEEPRKIPDKGAIYLFADGEEGPPLKEGARPAVWRFEPPTEQTEEEAEPEPEPGTPEEDAALQQADQEVLGALRPPELTGQSLSEWMQYLAIRQAMQQGGQQAGQIREVNNILKTMAGMVETSHEREASLRKELREQLEEQKEEAQDRRLEKAIYAAVAAFGPFGAEVLRDWAAEKRADREAKIGSGPAKLPPKKEEAPPNKGKAVKGRKGKAALPDASPENLLAAITTNPGALADLLQDPRVREALKERGLT